MSTRFSMHFCNIYTTSDVVSQLFFEGFLSFLPEIISKADIHMDVRFVFT